MKHLLIFSGLYSHAHGVVNNFTEYPANFKSFPIVLQTAGYDTAYFGKWHMGEDNDEPRPGFNWSEERHNLAANPKYAGEVKEMQAELLKVMKQVGLTPGNDKMPLDEGIKTELPDQKIR